MIYYFLISLPFLFFYVELIQKNKYENANKFWIISFFIFLVVFGFRHNIGGDWFQYKFIIEYLPKESLRFKDLQPVNISFIQGVNFINIFYYLVFILNKLNISTIYIVNFILSLFYLISLYRYCNSFKFRWLALLSTMPYLTIIVSTGYIKQALAISFLFLALSNFLKNNDNKGFTPYLILMFFSHISSAYLLIISVSKKNFKYLLLSGILIIILFYDNLLEILFNYVFEYEKKSKGFLFRLFINTIYLLPILFLIRKTKLSRNELILTLLNIIVIISSFIFFLLYPNTSTFLDRFNLYMMAFYPMYINLILINQNHIFFIKYINQRIIYISFYIFNIIYFFVWSNYGDAYKYWKYYDNIILKYVKIFLIT